MATTSRHLAEKSPVSTPSRLRYYLSALFIVLVVGTGVAMLCLTAGTKHELNTSILKYVPADANIVLEFKVDEIHKTEPGTFAINQFLGINTSQIVLTLRKGGIAIANVSHVTLAAKDWYFGSNNLYRDTNPNRFSDLQLKSIFDLNFEGNQRNIAIITLKESIDVKSFVQATNAQKRTKNTHSYYAHQIAINKSIRSQFYFFFPDERTMVLSSAPEIIEETIAQPPTELRMNQEMQNMIRQVGDGEIWFVMRRNALAEQNYLNLKPVTSLPYLSAGICSALKGFHRLQGSMKLQADGTLAVHGTLRTEEPWQTVRIGQLLNDELAERGTYTEQGLRSSSPIPSRLRSSVAAIHRTGAVFLTGSALDWSFRCSFENLIVLSERIANGPYEENQGNQKSRSVDVMDKNPDKSPRTPVIKR